MGILNQSYQFLQTRLLPHIPLQHQKLFAFGFSALTMQSFSSLNSNARMIISNRNTAESKIKRLVTKEKMLTHFATLLTQLELIEPTDRINVDFSSFCGYEVLTFAKQTTLGRAIPVYIAAITYPITDPGSQTQFIMDTITAFVSLLGFAPPLVFDRGFESPYLVPFLVKEHIPFTIRFKKDKHITYRMKEIPLRNLPWFEKDTMVHIYQDFACDTPLRIIVSEKVSERKDSQGKEEPWYLLTNDGVSEKEAVIARYYFRFEIEEAFKDIKYIYDLKKFYKIKKKQTFLILLWFCILGLWLSFLLAESIGYLQERLTQNKHKLLSMTRFFFEQLQREKNAILLTIASP